MEVSAASRGGPSGPNALLHVAGIAEYDEGAEHFAAGYRGFAADDGYRCADHHERSASFVDFRFRTKTVSGSRIHQVDLEFDGEDRRIRRHRRVGGVAASSVGNRRDNAAMKISMLLRQI